MESNDNYDGILGVANELARNNMTFVFHIGEMYALEQVGSPGKTVKATRVGNPNYHNLRDSHGRFARKV